MTYFLHARCYSAALLVCLAAQNLLSMELPTCNDFGDVELEGKNFVKGPPQRLQYLAAAALVSSIARTSQSNPKAAQATLENILLKIPKACRSTIKEAIWNLHDPCIVRSPYKKPLSGAYCCAVGFTRWETNYSQIGFARFGAIYDGLSRAIIAYDTGATTPIRDVIATVVGAEKQEHSIDFSRNCVFSDDGRYVAFVTNPVGENRAHICYISFYDRDTESWRSVVGATVSAAFLDNNRLIVRSRAGTFSLIDCSADLLALQEIFSVADQPCGAWGLFGEGILRVLCGKCFLYTPKEDAKGLWDSVSYELPASKQRAVASRRAILAYSGMQRNNTVSVVSFMKISKAGYTLASTIPVVADCAINDFLVRQFFGHEKLCAVEIASRNLIVIIACGDIENPQIIKKFDGRFSEVPLIMGHFLYSGQSIIMPNILLSYYAAYKKKQEQPQRKKSSPCILS